MALHLNHYSPEGVIETVDATQRQLVGFVPMLGSRGAAMATVVGMADSGAVASFRISILWARDAQGLTHTTAAVVVSSHATTDALAWQVIFTRHNDALVVDVAGSQEPTLWCGKIEATEAV